MANTLKLPGATKDLVVAGVANLIPELVDFAKVVASADEDESVTALPKEVVAEFSHLVDKFKLLASQVGPGTKAPPSNENPPVAKGLNPRVSSHAHNRSGVLDAKKVKDSAWPDAADMSAGVARKKAIAKAEAALDRAKRGRR